MCSRGDSVWIFDREQSNMNRTARKERMSNAVTTLAGMNDRSSLSCTNSHFTDRSVEPVPDAMTMTPATSGTGAPRARRASRTAPSARASGGGSESTRSLMARERGVRGPEIRVRGRGDGC